MPRSSAANAPTAIQDEEVHGPELPWLPTPANDPVVLSPEPFDGLLRGSRGARRTARLGGWVAAATVALIIAAAAAILTVGRLVVPDSRAGTVAGPAVGSVADRVALAEPTSPAGQGGAGAPSELTEGLNALRSRMQAAQSTGSLSTARVDSAPTPDPVAAVRPADADGAARTPAPASPAPATLAALTEPDAPRSGPNAAEVGAMLDRARGLIAVGDIAAARRLAEYAAGGGDGDALFALAETFDPAQLARWRVRGVRGDVEKARTLYRRALERGVAGATARLAGLP